MEVPATRPRVVSSALKQGSLNTERKNRPEELTFGPLANKLMEEYHHRRAFED